MKNKIFFVSAIVIILILSWFIGSKPADVVIENEYNQVTEKEETTKKIDKEIEQEINEEVDKKIEQEINEEVDKKIEQEINKEVDKEIEQETNEEIDKEIEQEINEEVDKETEQEINEEVSKETEQKQTENKKDKYLTDPIPEGKPSPVEPQDVIVKKKESFEVELSVRCDTILNNMDLLDENKVEIVPIDGVIFPSRKVIA